MPGAFHYCDSADIPYRIPTDSDLPERLSSVLAVLYLIYNAAVDRAPQASLRTEVVRLARALVELQVAIHAVHCNTESLEATDWPQIVELHDHLYALMPTPVVALNRAIATSAFQRAHDLARTSAERRFLADQLERLAGSIPGQFTPSQPLCTLGVGESSPFSGGQS